MHVNRIISELAIKSINKYSVITDLNHRLQAMACVLGLLFANTAGVKIIIKHAVLDSFHYVLIQVMNYGAAHV